MSTENVRRSDWIIGGLALVLVIVLLELPWYTVGGGTVSGISLPSISEPATGSPGAVFGLFGVIAALAVLLDLVLEHLSPDTNVPAVGDSRTLTRLVLAGVSAFFLALKFVFNLSKVGNFGVGCWLGLALVAGLVYAAERARRQDPGPHRHAAAEADQEEDGDRSADDEESEREGSDREGAADREQPERSDRPGDEQREQSAEEPRGSTPPPSRRQPSAPESEGSGQEPGSRA